MAHSHYNPKDIPLVIFSLITLIFLYLSFTKKEKLYAFFAGLMFGVSLAKRVNALLITPIFFISYFLSLISKKRTPTQEVKIKQVKKDIVLLFVFLTTSLFTVFITWPALWKDPALFIKSINFFLQHDWKGEVLYIGDVYSASQLPWHYVAVFAFMTTPSLTLLFSVFGLLLCIDNLRLRKKFFEYLLIVLWALIPIVVSIKSGLIRYDGIRHYFIAIPALMILAGLGFYLFVEKLKGFFPKNKEDIKIIIYSVLAAVFILEILRIFPFGGSYFNEITRFIIPSHIEDHFEIEYWGATYKQGIAWLNKNAKPNSVVCVPVADHLLQFYPRRADLAIGCVEESNYLMFITRWTYLPENLDEVYHYQEKEPVFKISKLNSDLLYIYYLQ